jgi:hypothetical protein
MIDTGHDLPITRQAQLLELSRSAVYYRPQPMSEADLALMRQIDALHLDHPFAGARMLRDLLRQDGYAVGRKHVVTLMCSTLFSQEIVDRRRGSRTGDPPWKFRERRADWLGTRDSATGMSASSFRKVGFGPDCRRGTTALWRIRRVRGFVCRSGARFH